MTFILNILHQDMSILAADKKAVANWPTTFGFARQEKAIVSDYKKVTMNLNGQVAIGVSGYSEHNFYIRVFEKSESISDGLLIIRKHMENFLRVDDLATLVKSASPFVNECVASFYDYDTDTFFTNEFHYNEFTNKTHLHRAAENIKVFCAGSGRNHFDIPSGEMEIQSLVNQIDKSRLQDVCIEWMKNVFTKVSEKDEGCGSEATFAISTRDNPVFRVI